MTLGRRGGRHSHAFPPEFDVVYRPRRSRRANLVQVSGAVIAEAGQNGHLELYVGKADPPELLVGAIAVRAEPPGAGRVGAGGQLTAVVPPGHRYRFRRHTVAGFAEPEFVFTTFVTELAL